MIDSPSVMLSRLDEMIESKDYAWARNTLEGIRATIQFNGRVTLRQQEAVEHIIVGRLKHLTR